MYKIRLFFIRLKRLLSAIPVIWTCEEWDFVFLLELIKWKLLVTADYFENSGIAAGDKIKAAQMRATAAAIDTYFDPEEEFIRNHGALPFEIEHVFVPTEGGSRLITMNKGTGKPLTEEEEEQYSMYLKASFKYESEDCWEKIWDLLKQHGQSRWN